MDTFTKIAIRPAAPIMMAEIFEDEELETLFYRQFLDSYEDRKTVPLSDLIILVLNVS